MEALHSGRHSFEVKNHNKGFIAAAKVGSCYYSLLLNLFKLKHEMQGRAPCSKDPVVSYHVEDN